MKLNGKVKKNGKMDEAVVQATIKNLKINHPIDYEKLRRRLRDALNKTDNKQSLLEIARILDVKI